MMEGKKLPTLALALMMLLMLCSMASPALACPSNGSGCKACILDQMKYGCPSCVPLIRCMARCLWGGTSRSKCISRCDCNGGKPRLSDCKKCMSRCKCSCVA
ncbi:hypothetical protein QUC31_013276 [Theobroma cacao]|uniref:Uncharacterized protein LOC108662610 n=1 Tax=Theobroma cacao TaxID=3641 RepID=A0AB32WMH2_THECC|nr:PREDICTED: uncharacterized protein LOC108662610 [Theobroma cacao]